MYISTTVGANFAFAQMDEEINLNVLNYAEEGRTHCKSLLTPLH